MVTLFGKGSFYAYIDLVVSLIFCGYMIHQSHWAYVAITENFLKYWWAYIIQFSIMALTPIESSILFLEKKVKTIKQPTSDNVPQKESTKE